MAISELKIKTKTLRVQEQLFELHPNLGAFAAPRPEHHRTLRGIAAGRGATAMSIAREGEFARPKPVPEENPGGQTHNEQRNCFLPIHTGNLLPVP